MKNEIIKLLVANICDDFSDIIIVGLDEEKEKFPYTLAVINFIVELREKEININLSSFSDKLRDNLYMEFKNYLAR